MDRARIVVCLLNNQAKISVEEANLRLTQIGVETRLGLMNVARSQGCPLNSIRPTGFMPDLSDSKIQLVLNLYDDHASTATECLIFLGLHPTSESQTDDGLIQVKADPWLQNNGDRVACNRYACYFSKCRKTFPDVAKLLKHQKIHVSVCPQYKSVSLHVHSPATSPIARRTSQANNT